MTVFSTILDLPILLSFKFECQNSSRTHRVFKVRVADSSPKLATLKAGWEEEETLFILRWFFVTGANKSWFCQILTHPNSLIVWFLINLHTMHLIMTHLHPAAAGGENMMSMAMSVANLKRNFSWKTKRWPNCRSVFHLGRIFCLFEKTHVDYVWCFALLSKKSLNITTSNMKREFLCKMTVHFILNVTMSFI